MNWHNLAVMWCTLAGILAFFALLFGTVSIDEKKYAEARRFTVVFIAAVLVALTLGSLLVGELV